MLHHCVCCKREHKTAQWQRATDELSFCLVSGWANIQATGKGNAGYDLGYGFLLKVEIVRYTKCYVLSWAFRSWTRTVVAQRWRQEFPNAGANVPDRRAKP